MRFGIYIHFPWCRKRCPYCDFAVTVAKSEPPHREYLQAIYRELDRRAPLFEGKTLVSIYFGGGTPSLWEPACVAELIDRLRGRFGAETADIEVNLECNPIDCRPSAFDAWHQAGINRVLVGVQSTNDRDLVVLGRDHRVGDGAMALRSTMAAGFSGVGADVILGVPGSVDPLRSLEEVAYIGPSHISAYELTIEERTAFAGQVKRGELVPEEEDVIADLLLGAHEMLLNCGYEHYEVSSYSKPGQRAIHNSLYWQGADYLGLGTGAASLLRLGDGGARRWQNRRSTRDYMTQDLDQVVDFKEEISTSEFATECLWLAMRTSAGAPETDFDGREDVRDRLLCEGLIERHSTYLRPTMRGYLYNNQLIARLGAGKERLD